MNEDLGPARAQVARDRLRQGAALAEEQALLAGRERDRLAGEIQRRRAAENGNLTLRGWLRRIDDRTLTARAAREPRQDRRGFPTVALRPMRCTSFSVSRTRRSITLSRCAPRSVPASAWTSSMITNRRSEKRRLVLTFVETSITSRDSGVVISTSAGSREKRFRSASLTSPLPDEAP